MEGALHTDHGVGEPIHQPYFNDRERGLRPSVREEITQDVWDGIVTVEYEKYMDGDFRP